MMYYVQQAKLPRRRTYPRVVWPRGSRLPEPPEQGMIPMNPAPKNYAALCYRYRLYCDPQGWFLDGTYD